MSEPEWAGNCNRTAWDSGSGSQSMRDRIEGAELAAEIVRLAEIDDVSLAKREGFFRGLKRLCDDNLPAPPKDDPRPVMTDEQAARFERQTVGFGRYAEHTWGEVPNSYIAWLHAQEIKLGAYLRSERGQRRQD